MPFGQGAGDLLRAQIGQPALAVADLAVQLPQPVQRGLGDVVVDAAVVAGQAGLVGVEVAVVGEHEHPQLRQRVQGGAEPW